MKTAARRARPGRGVLLVVAATVLTLLGGGPLLMATAGAQTSEEPRPMEVRLTQIDGVLVPEPDAALSATLQLQAGRQDRDDLRLVTTVYSRVTEAEDLRRALAGDPVEVYSSVSEDIPAMPPGTSRIQAVSLTADDLSLDSDGVSGVFPVEFRVFQEGESVAAITSAIIVVPADAPPSLPASMVVTVNADALPTDDGVVAPSLARLAGPDSPLVRQTRDLAETAADGSAAGLTLVVSGRLLADLDDMADGFSSAAGGAEDSAGLRARRAGGIVDRLRVLARRADTELLSLPYGPADLVALVRGGQPDEAVRLTDIGRQVTREVVGVRATAEIIVPSDGVDAATVAALGQGQPDAFLLEERYLSFAADPGLHPVRRLRTADGGVVRILVPDAGLSALLQDRRGQGTAAILQHLLAQTALAWLSDDNQSSTGVLLDLTAPGAVPAGMIQAVNDVLADVPWLRPMTLSSLSDAVDPSERVVRLAYPSASQAAELDAEYIASLGAAREALVPIRALLPASQDAATQLGRSLLVAAALPYRDIDHRSAGLARITAALDTLDGLADAVDVVDGPPITLTSTTGEIPVTLRNTSEVPLTVRIRLGSTGFEFDEPSRELALPPQATQTITFRARALNPGGIAGVGVVVEDPSGGLALVETTLAVRSTALPIVAVIAVVGGCGFLVIWGIREGRRRRLGPAEAAGARADESVA